MKKVILTGIRANSNLTIGNYFGAILPMVDMAKNHSDEYQINLFVPDLHSFTTPIDHTKLKEQIMHALRVFVAAGLPIEHDDVHVYRQSYIPANSEMTWILDCFTGMGELSRMTQFKEKSYKEDEDKQGEDRVSVGLFNYPVLMACDILLYNASYVPVGEDQTQHLEFTRDIAERMNAKFGDLFVVPENVKKQHEFFGKDQGLRIKDLQDPSKKMSKSDESGKGVIYLSDSPDEAAKKIMSATTDSVGVINFDKEKQPGISNLLLILSLLTHRSLDEVVKEFEGKTSYGELKTAVAEAIKAFLTDLQPKLKENHDDEILAKLKTSELAMNEVANATLLRTQKAIGIR